MPDQNEDNNLRNSESVSRILKFRMELNHALDALLTEMVAKGQDTRGTIVKQNNGRRVMLYMTFDEDTIKQLEETSTHG